MQQTPLCRLVHDAPARSTVLAALALLGGSYRCAELLGEPAASFAVNLASLRRTGVTEDQLLLLVDVGLVEHLDEARRRRCQPGPRVFPAGGQDTACFALTALGAMAARRTLAELEVLQPTGESEGERPQWLAQRRELRLGSQLVKRFTRLAPYQQRLLAAFEQRGWPGRIDNPLVADECPAASERLLNAVKGLNRRHLCVAMRFALAPDQAGVCWMAVPAAGAKSL